MRNVVFTILIVLFSGCGSGGEPNHLIPLHVEILVRRDDIGTLADQTEAHFQQWIEETNLEIPGSTFSALWYDGRAGTVEVFACVSIPSDWGRRRNRNMNRFISEGKAMIQEAVLRSRPARSTSACPRSDSGIRRLYVLDPDWDSALSGLDVGPAEPGIRPRREPFNMVVICDSSNSTQNAACNSVEIKYAYRLFVSQALHAGAGAFAIWRVGDSRLTTTKLISLSLPDTAVTVGEQAGFWLANTGSIGKVNLAPDSDSKSMSAILQAIPLASEWLQEKSGSKLMVVLTDGRQADNFTGINFERSAPGPQRFIDIVENAGQAPRLVGVDVIMAGLGTHRSAKSTTDERVRSCWEKYFQHFGAKSSVIFLGSISEVQLSK